MKNRNLIVLLLLLAVVLIIAATVAVSHWVKPDAPEGTKQVSLYFLNPIENKLESEDRFIKEEEPNEMIKNILDELKAVPKNANLIPAIPDAVEFLSFSVKQDENDKSVVKINMSEEYADMEATEELYARFAIVRSLTELYFIDGVHLLVDGGELLRTDGKPLGILYGEDMLNNPVISPDKTNRQTITLYFSDEQAMGLVKEERQIEVKQSQTLEYQILEQLIAGPSSEDLYPTIPEGTKIRNIKTEDRVCYVDLSGEFVLKHSGGSTGEYLTIYSIVNSLTDPKNLETVKKVQFTVDGKKVTDFKGHMDLSKPFERDDEAIIDSE